MPNADSFAEATKKTTEIGRAVVNHLNAGEKSDEPLWAAYWDAGFESVEGDGQSWKGIDEVRKKHAEWYAAFTVHNCKAEGPYVTNDAFAVKIEMEIEANDGSMPRISMSEIGLYTVADGKVVREQFFNAPRD
ncbi:MAG: hypothetical protein CMJ31_02965 [Phycisphaerae bacterium]|nr:hypothetical protein [Phycisphaerae bacterium]